MKRFTIAALAACCLVGIVSIADARERGTPVARDDRYAFTTNGRTFESLAGQRASRRAVRHHRSSFRRSSRLRGGLRAGDHRVARGAGLVTVGTAAGIPITVAARAAANFSGFITELTGTGYRISLIGGWRRHGSCAGCDMHPRGLAIDINQTGRNRVTRALPAGVTEMAARHGLTHGAVWRRPDQGHFELAGVHHYARHAHRPIYAHRSHRYRYAAG